MSRQKCTECGLVNFADEESCKRCKSPLHKLPQPTREERQAKLDEAYAMQGSADPPSLGTFNGIGTRLLGWRHHEDGTATATVWLTVFYLPLFPMGRWRLVSPTKDDFEPTFSMRQLLTVLSPSKSVTTEYQFVEWLKISGQEVLFTYFYAYLWVPFKVFLPLWLLFHFTPTPDKNDGSMTSALIYGPLMMVWMGYVLVVLTRLLHQTRGGH